MTPIFDELLTRWRLAHGWKRLHQPPTFVNCWFEGDEDLLEPWRSPSRNECLELAGGL